LPAGKRPSPAIENLGSGKPGFFGKKLAVTLTDELDPKTRGYLEKITVQAWEVLKAGEVLYTTWLYDMDELRRFERGAEKLKKEMRSRQWIA